MPVSESQHRAVEQVVKVIDARAYAYESGLQTTILGRQPDGWRNLLTKFEYVCKGRRTSDPVLYKYRDVIIVRRRVETPEVLGIFGKLVQESTLETGTEPEVVPMETGSSVYYESVRAWKREWSEWPGDIVSLNDSSQSRPRPPQTSLVSVDAPYYPSTVQVLYDLFGFRPINDSDYLNGRVILVVPDFRARVSKLTIGRDYLRAELDCAILQPSDVVGKTYAENSTRRLAQETVELASPLIELNLDDRATFASVALLSKSTGELLHEKSFDERRGWDDNDVVIKASEQEIEQMILLGETETIEFKRKLDRVRIARTVVAFANTQGGTIIVGVEDDGRVVGCDPNGVADTVANIVRDRCDPPPTVSTEVVEYEGKTLFLIRVEESTSQVHVEKEHGPLIRVNGTTRTPTSYELDRLYQRRNITEMLPQPRFL